MTNLELKHKSVLLDELSGALSLSSGDIAIDCTVGAGGHTLKLLQAVGPSGRVVGIDRDETALAIARQRLTHYLESGSLTLVKAPFSELSAVVDHLKLSGQVQGLCADIGVSSMHLDESSRGFSFLEDGPLDMRMDQAGPTTAADLIANLDEADLTKLFRDYGEEPKAKQIARRIVSSREISPITTTRQLADLIKSANLYPTVSRKHPATRVFQALRIAVNDELGELSTLLDDGLSVLRPGGRMAIISFHSLEDRMVKTKFLDYAGKAEKGLIPRDLPITAAELSRRVNARAEIVKPFPVVPSSDEIGSNPRSRSAKMRVLTKL